MKEEFDNELEQKRPVLLTVLAVLTFITTGLGILAVLFSLIMGPMNEEQILKQRVQMAQSKTEIRSAGMNSFVDILDKMQGIAEETNEHFFFANGLLFITYGVGLFGVIMMLRRRRLGFHLYIIYTLLALGGMYLYVSAENIPMVMTVINVVIAGVFVYLYSRTLKWLR